MKIAGRRLPVSTLVALSIALLGAGWSWSVVFVSPGARVVVSGLLGPLLVVCATRMRRKTPPLAITALLEFLMALLLWIILAPADEGSLGKILTGVLHGWNTILSAAVPVDTGNGATAFAYVISALAGVISFEILFRTRTRIWPSVPALCLATLAYFMGRGGPSSVLFPTILLIVGAVSLALLRSRAAAIPGAPFDESLPEDEDAESAASESRWGRKEAAVVGAIVALAIGIVVMLISAIPIFGGRNPTELHDSYVPKERTAAAVNPLDQVAESETMPAGSSKILFSVKLSERFKDCSDAKVDRCPRFPIAYLPNFDGSSTWNSDAILQPASERVDPPSSPKAGKTRLVKQTITVNKDYQRGVLPGLERLVRVSKDAASRSREVDPATGLRTLSVNDLNTKKQGPIFSFEAWSKVRTLTDADLKSTYPDPAIKSASERLGLGEFPVLQNLRDKKICDPTVNQNAGFLKLCIWEKVLAKYAAEKVNDSPGYSLSRLEAFLSAEKPSGTTDQFATSFATVATSLGWRVRVVVGYQVVKKEAAFDVTSSDLRAWPEVALSGLGWVAFSPFPGVQGVASPPTTTTTSSPAGSSTTPSTTPISDPNGEQNCEGRGRCGPVVGANDSSDQGAPIVLLLSLALVALGIIASAPGLLAARRRRRAHTEGDPETRISAAWNDALDRLREEGRDEVECLTAQAAETATATSFGLESAAEVAMLGVKTDRALHAPTAPQANDADEAWRHADALRVLVDQTRTRWRRLRSRAIPARWR